MGRKITINDEDLTKPLSGRLGAKIRLSVVRYVHPKTLRANPLNTKYFSAETPEALRLLEEDIATRGILVPLIAKPDGTLLAGHNRLQSAQNLRLQDIPVQFVETPLSAQEEREMVVKDNLLRRQLTTEKRIALYKMLYPDFEANFLNAETQVQAGRKKASEQRTTIRQIAEETGQTIPSVKKQIQQFRTKKPSQDPTKTTKPKNGYPVSISKKMDTKQDSSALKGAKRALDSLTKYAANLENDERNTLRRLMKEIAKTL